MNEKLLILILLILTTGCLDVDSKCCKNNYNGELAYTNTSIVEVCCQGEAVIDGFNTKRCNGESIHPRAMRCG